MRLNLYWRGRDVIDVELHIWKPRPPEGNPVVVVTNTRAETELADEQEPGISGFGFGP